MPALVAFMSTEMKQHSNLMPVLMQSLAIGIDSMELGVLYLCHSAVCSQW